MKILTVIILSFLLSGCIYPVYRTIQPETKVEVLNEKDMPIGGAKVYLSTTEFYPYKFKVEIVRSDEEGIAQFDSIKKWGTDMLMIHGIKPENHWALCVEKENYKTKVVRPRDKDDFSYQKVILRVGKATDCLDEDVMQGRTSIMPRVDSEQEQNILTFDFSTIYTDRVLANKVSTLISKMLDKQTASKAYADLEQLGRKATPYIIMQMEDFRELLVISISLKNKNRDAFEGIRHIGVKKVVDVLSEILTQLEGKRFYYIANDEKSDEDRKRDIYAWREWLLKIEQGRGR